MGRRGPRKTPTALAALRGFPGKQRKSREPEPATPPVAARKPPAWLDREARAEWRRLEPELSRLGLLTLLDLTKFAAYCRWYARWRDYEARLEVLRHQDPPGDIISTASTVKPHVLVAMAKHAAEMMTRLGSHFGLSPSDRTGVGLPLDPTAPAHDRPDRAAPAIPRDEFDEFLTHNRRPPHGPLS